jgi:DNA-binding SARP family transcriptional activator/tetratricopeptide (TPR) repeat protein
MTQHDVLISVLGPLTVARDGAAVLVGGRRQVAVLARLVVADAAGVSPEVLADDIWGGVGSIDAARMAVSRLRQAIGPAAIVTTGNGYALDLDVCRTDVREFEAALAVARRASEAADQVARYHEAMGWWRGAAFADVRDLGFCLTERERLDELRLVAIGEQVDARLRAGESFSLVPELEQRATEHPWREHITEQLMLALYRAGRQREAINAFHRLESTLREELGIEPNPTVRALHAAVLAQSPELDLVEEAPARPPVGTVRTDPGGRLMGRSAETERIHRAWRRAQDESRARVVLVAGAPGIGKSTLLDAASKSFTDEGGAVLRAACPPQDRVPFQAIADALRPFIAEIGDRALEADLAALAAILPGVGSLPLSQAGSGAEPALHRAVVRSAVESALRLCVESQRTALVIDDLQWIDPGSLAFVSDAWRSLRDQPLLLLLGCRSNELAVEGPVTGLLSSLTEQSPVATVELAGLDETSTRGLVADLVPADWEGDVDDLARLVNQTTSGHPFFIQELVHDVVHAADVETGLRGAVSTTLDATIEQRVAGLPAPERALVNVAAVIGPSMTTDLLAAVVGRSATEVAAEAGVLVRAGLLRPTLPMPGYEFEHSLVRQVLLEKLPPARRARLHASIGEALEAAGCRPEELSHHFVNALPFIHAERVARAALDAGDTAMEAAAFEQAAVHYQHGLDVLASSSPDPALRIRVLVNLGNALATGTDAGPARRCFDEAAALAREGGFGELLAEALTGRAQFGVDPANRDADVAKVVEALALLPDRDSWVRARLLIWAVWVLLYGDDPARAHPYLDEALAIAERLDDPQALAAALQVRHALLVAELAPLEERDRVRARIRQLPIKLTRYEGTLINGASVFDDLIEHGDLAVLRRELDRYRRDADEVGRPYDRWSARSIRFVTESWTGDLDAAEAAMTEASTLGQSLGIGVSQGLSSAHLLMLAWERDQLGPLVEIVEAMAAAAAEPTFWQPVLALTYQAAGRPDDARRTVMELRDGFPQIRHPQPRAAIAVLASETVGLAGDDVLTRVIEQELEPRSGRLFVAPTAAYTFGPYDRMIGLCAMARGDLDLAVERLQAARLLAEKFGMAIWEPRAAVHEADARLRRGGRSEVDAARELLDSVDRSAAAIGSGLLTHLAADVRARHHL